ncbi:hypothetical protein CEP52_003597 [Fusarium oligoseptatum]|uniref:Tyrosine specific protein phosphatases domain-containing protein n=1 Tax=Fusarium oligoseptatum TaxID=2604345 RepID=A0A428U873_9HYPO|nr:hypothetical protein CEP52_003597 [Fusarium oligoseptatum]
MTLSRADLEDLAATHVRDAIPPEPLAAALSFPPFIPTQSLVNIRDLGAVPGSAIRPGRIFRSGMLDAAAADPEALAWLAANVGTVFDLRSERERAGYPSPEVPGVKNLFLFHCTAGRDRTGVVAGLLQTLAGTEQPDVIFDYMLSRIGTEQARDRLVVFIKTALGVDDPETPGFWNMASLRPSFWKALVEGVDAEFGGWDGYVTGALGFSADDLETIKKNLRA